MNRRSPQKEFREQAHLTYRPLAPRYHHGSRHQSCINAGKGNDRKYHVYKRFADLLIRQRPDTGNPRESSITQTATSDTFCVQRTRSIKVIERVLKRG